ncbi:TraB/GumN family protein [Candidatus Woesearchaeota archaeon]|nr:TraB/GumN family protein [Candidatus Woesearchaeota archaeon]
MPDLPIARLPFEWELKHNGVVSHLVGTFHALPYDVAGHIGELVSGKTAVLVEHADSPESFKAAMKHAMLRKAAPVIDAMNAESAAGFANSIGLDVDAARRAPLAALYSAYVKGAMPSEVMPVDSAMENAAARSGIRRESMETLEETLRLFDSVLNMFSQRLISNVWYTREQAKQFFSEMMRAYMSGQPRAVLEAKDVTGMTLDTFAQQYPDLFWPRHQNMVERSLKHMESPVLVAIGYGHCLVEPSVLTLYKEHGVGVVRV